MILTDADELRATLALVMRERDEARADLHSLQGAHETLRQAIDERNAAILDRDEARAEVERLTEERDRVARELRRIDEHGSLRAAIRAAAERQREACATRVLSVRCGKRMKVGWAANFVRETPLVTEVES